jgi:hypothetical protein
VIVQVILHCWCSALASSLTCITVSLLDLIAHAFTRTRVDVHSSVYCTFASASLAVFAVSAAGHTGANFQDIYLSFLMLYLDCHESVHNFHTYQVLLMLVGNLDADPNAHGDW